MARPIAWMGTRPLDPAQYPPTRPFAHIDDVEESLDAPKDIGSSRDLPKLSRPPSYATTDPTSAPSYSRVATTSGQSAAYRLSDQMCELRHSKPGLAVVRVDTDKVVYYIGRYSAINTPDVIIYTGPDSRGRISAQSRLTAAKDIKFIVGDIEAHPEADWSTAKSVSEGRILHSDSWHFSPPSAVDSASVSELAWKQTHDRHLGSGKLRSKDFKLVDSASDALLAVYLDSGPSDISSAGNLEFKQPLQSAEAELAALVVLMATRERSRRHNRRSGVVNRSQDPGLRHGI